jgi:hypothetical protein
MQSPSRPPSRPSAFLGNVADLNSSAVALLQGSTGGTLPTEGARKLLFQGLHQLKTVCDSIRDEHNGQGVESIPQAFLVQLLHPDPKLSERWEDGTQEIFSGAFLFGHPHDHLQRSLAAAVLLYNVGLLHHRAGLQTEVSSHVKSAQRYYKLSLMLLQQQKAATQDEKFHGSLNLLEAALLTNTAHAYKYFYEMNEATTFFHNLARQMENMPIDHEGGTPMEAVAYFEKTLLYNLALRCHDASPAA